MAKNKKLIASVAAVATSAALLLGGTLAWQSTNQTALNEASDVINPGGRLHDDFDGTNKDVYVENFADENIYARIRLEEYFEIITNYGKGSAEKPHELIGSKTTNEETGEVEYTYELFTGYANMQDGVVKAAIDINDVDAETGEAKSYWSWQTGGSTVYMPTFNLNKDSLLADVNGIYEEGNVGTISNRFDPDEPQYTEYTDYMELGVGYEETANELYDGDANDIDEFTDGGNGNVELADIIANGENSAYYTNYESSIELVAGEEHTATTTLDAELISMDKWLEMVEYDNEGNVTYAPDNYWVYDEDGWVYWSAPIEPHTATGLLLDGIELNQVMDDTWYYAINVIAQFVTADDVGKSDSTGFYAEGEAPSADAETLLEAIGVDMSGEVPEEEEGPIAFRIYNKDTDDGVNYHEGEIAYLGAGDYTLFVSSGDGGHYTGETPTGFTWSVDPQIDYMVNEIRDASGESNEGLWYVSVDFTLDDTIEEDTEFTFTATNETDGFEMVATVVYGEDPSGGEDVPEVIDMPLDVYVKYDDGTYAGAQPLHPETHKPVEGVIQIFALLIDQNPMNLGATLTTVDGGLLDSSSGDFVVTYSFDEYESNMSPLWNSDAPDEEYTFTISTVEDEGDELYGYQVATCDDTNQRMVALHPTTGRLLMLAEEQPINQSVYVTATTTYNGETYESNSQCLFFINRDIIMHVDWVDAPNDDPGHSGEYTPGEETTFILKANLYINNDVQPADKLYTYPITWSVKDSDGNDAPADVTIVDNKDYTATVTVTGDAAASRYIVSATYIHDDEDGRNKGEYTSFFGINSTVGGDDEGGDDDSDSTLEMTFSSSPEYTENGDGTATIEIDKNGTDEFIWNLYGCTEGKFTLSSSNEKVRFEPYSGDDSNLNFDMNIIIPVDVTENFTVTATSMDGTKSVVFHVVMTDNTDNT